MLVGIVAMLIIAFWGDDKKQGTDSTPSETPILASGDLESARKLPTLQSRSPLIPSRTWTRESDARTIDAAVLHVRKGEVVFLSDSGEWSAAPVRQLVASDQQRLRDAMATAPTFPAAWLIGATRDQARLLLGAPDQVLEEFDQWDLPGGNSFTTRHENDQVMSFSIANGWEGDLSSLLDYLGLDYMSPNAPRINGPYETIQLRAADRSITFRGTRSDKGWVPVNFDF